MESYGRKKTNINQVAYMAGVSVTTVSIYLGGNKKVCSEATARRIDQAVAELNYQPNPLAGTVYNKVQRTIGLLASDDLERGSKPWVVLNMRVVSGIFEIANESNYGILAYPYRVYLERQYRAALDGRVDGILFYGSEDHEIVQKLAAADMPVVCMGIPEEVQIAAGAVHADERMISDLAISHLWERGHRRIAHLCGPFADCSRHIPGPGGEITLIPEAAEPVSLARRMAAQEYLEQREAYDPDLFSGPHAWHDPDVAPALERLWKMKDKPTAIYCANDYIAWKAIEWARARKISIPQELAIVGVDNIESPDQESFLSSIEIPVEEIGRQAMHLVLEILAGSASPHTVRAVQPTGLVSRASSQFLRA